jgi:hypothetical protein
MQEQVDRLVEKTWGMKTIPPYHPVYKLTQTYSEIPDHPCIKAPYDRSLRNPRLRYTLQETIPHLSCYHKQTYPYIQAKQPSPQESPQP